MGLRLLEKVCLLEYKTLALLLAQSQLPLAQPARGEVPKERMGREDVFLREILEMG